MTNAPSCLRILVAEDNEDLRAAICALVSGEPDMTVAAEASTPPEIVAMACAHDADIVVLDLNLRGESSVAAMRELQHQRPNVGAVIYSGYDAAEVMSGLQGLEPCLYVSKSGDGMDLLLAIRQLGNSAAGAGL
jgi:DNA-binding NarL/FixJ family response regulator